MREQPSIEPITLNDAVALMDLAESVGWRWRSIPDQVKMFISTGTLFGHRLDGRLISSAGIYQYGSLDSLGVVIVHSDFQRQGLGKSIVKRCLVESEQTGAPVTLVATAQGFPLYTSLGFQTIGQIHRFDCEEPRTSDFVVDKDRNVSPIQESDLSELIRFDQIVFGADRSQLYRILFSNMECGFIVRNPDNSIQGFGLGIRKNNMIVVGPLIASTADIATLLIHKFISFWTGPVRIDVPGEQVPFMTQLTEAGFKETMVSPLMLRNADNLPGQRNQLFGIADPVFG